MGHITLVLLQFRIPFPIVYSIQEILLSLYTLSYRLNCRKNKNDKKRQCATLRIIEYFTMLCLTN